MPCDYRWVKLLSLGGRYSYKLRYFLLITSYNNYIILVTIEKDRKK